MSTDKLTEGGETVVSISRWLGLNQAPDGDTKLRYGEAARMVNFRITRDGNLQRRGGYKAIAEFGTLQGLWHGTVAGCEIVAAAADGQLWVCPAGELDGGHFVSVGLCGGGESHMFAFGGRMYVLCAEGYLVYDGETLQTVAGYVPLVTVASPPAGGGTELEGINALTAKRRCRFCPDGSSATLQLPERGLRSIDRAVFLPTGQTLAIAARDCSGGTLTLQSAPPEGINTVEITYTAQEEHRASVEGMRFHELFSGEGDTRVFLYGDGSNRAIFSEIDYDGLPRADYFPVLNTVSIGDENTPLTAMTRHFSKLLAFKKDSCHTLAYSPLSLADGRETAAFYAVCVNKSIGMDAPGQVCLVLNAPFTVHNRDIYEWRSNTTYNGALSNDERQAVRISDRVTATLQRWDGAQCRCCDDNAAQEYYICCGDEALVYNYAADAWSFYDHFPARYIIAFGGRVLLGGSDGRLYDHSRQHRSDNGAPITARWESGAMSFGGEYLRKSAAVLWLGVKPESDTRLTVRVVTDRKADSGGRSVNIVLSSFSNMNFANFGFCTNYRPQIRRLKLKVRKFVYYRLCFELSEKNASATVLSCSIRVRTIGTAK